MFIRSLGTNFRRARPNSSATVPKLQANSFRVRNNNKIKNTERYSFHFQQTSTHLVPKQPSPFFLLSKNRMNRFTPHSQQLCNASYEPFSTMDSREGLFHGAETTSNTRETSQPSSYIKNRNFGKMQGLTEGEIPTQELRKRINSHQDPISRGRDLNKS